MSVQVYKEIQNLGQKCVKLNHASFVNHCGDLDNSRKLHKAKFLSLRE